VTPSHLADEELFDFVGLAANPAELMLHPK